MVEGFAFQVVFVASLALCHLRVLEFSMQGIGHFSKVGVEESRVEGFLVDSVVQHDIMRIERQVGINLVSLAELVFGNAAALECFADVGLSLLAFAQDFFVRSALVVYLGCDGLVNLQSLSH